MIGREGKSKTGHDLRTINNRHSWMRDHVDQVSEVRRYEMKRIILKRDLCKAKDAMAEIEMTANQDDRPFQPRAFRVRDARDSVRKGLIALEAMERRLTREG